jgi:hypothetical protein
MGAAVALVLALVLPARWPAGLPVSGFEQAVRARAEAQLAAPPSFCRLERQVVLATGEAGSSELHYMLRPVLRQIAAHRLAVQHGIDLDGQPAQARALLGDELFDLMRADRPKPEDGNGPGLPLEDLRDMADRLGSL